VLLDFIREGDTLVVTKLDWLARSIGHLSEIIEHLDAKKADLQVLAMNLDTSTATGRLMLNVIGSVAQFEREMMLERQCEGIARAKSEGKYKGRASTARAKSADVLALKAQGLGGTEIAKRLGIGRASVYRVLGEPAYRLRAPRRRAAGATSRALFSPGTGEVPRLLPFRMALVGVQGDEQAEEEQPA
jgi:DNA invertase Pin-like site-specific DNA recombinase